MLESLSIRNIVLIEALDLDFSPGLNVLTGETGAGKSILLDALGLALGRRDGRGLLRPGAEEGAVTAVLRCPADHPARALLAAAGVPWDDEALILRRMLSAEGRARAFVNDQRVSADNLRAIGETLVEVHGQADDRGLMNARGHRALLDEFAEAGDALAAAGAAWRTMRAAEQAADEAAARLEAARRDREYLEHAAAELSAFDPEEGEDAELDARRRRMQAGERIRAEVAAAASEIEGAEMAAGQARRRLDGLAAEAEGRLDGALDALAAADEALSEASSGVAAALDALTFDPGELEATEERLFALRALARKHKVHPDELRALALEFRARLDGLIVGEEEIGRLRRAAREAAAAYDAAAAALTELRRAAAAALDAAIAAELPSLKLDRARFATAVEPAEAPGPEGRDRVAFTIATIPGAPPGPLAAVASGGELSRVLLALKVALAARGAGGVMIFDEIDRGVGGATADAVGRRLKAVAAGAQVLVVTHAPQVAAFGDAHFRIEKSMDAEGARTDVTRLTGPARRDEIARMLAGDEVTDAARAAASALIG